MLVHYVLVHNLPALVGPLDTALQLTLDTVGNPQKRAKGRRIGAEAPRR